MSAVIAASEEVKQFINQYLEKLGVNNYTLDIVPAVNRGDNYLGYVARVEVKNADGDVLYNWIVKSAPDNLIIRATTPIHKMYEREITMYTNVFPAFIKLQEDNEVTNHFKSFPKYYTSSTVSPHECIVMEDMKKLGYELKSRQEALNFGHLRLVMKEYGRLHALSFVLRDQRPEEFQKLSESLEDVTVNEPTIEYMIQKELNTCKKALASLDPVVNKTLYDKFQNVIPNLKNDVVNLVKSSACEKTSVFNHGDCWNNNYLFKYENQESSLPSDVCFLDWQVSRCGSPVFDLSYFLFTCTNKEIREEYYEKLIAVYYESLTFFMRRCGSDAEIMFPFRVLQEHFKKYSLFGLYVAIQFLGVILKDPNDVPEDILTLTNLEDALEKFLFLNEHNEEYTVAIKDVLLDFDKYGYNFNI
ncbi:hypothetical protein FQA39_LY13830 [Lamprigera yunnana]|nr:hypothetical protein FQA39_LY13830 [Lamprigera yunnana]